jgi:hypothetical protein
MSTQNILSKLHKKVELKSRRVDLNRIGEVTANIANATEVVYEARNEVITLQGNLEAILGEVKSSIVIMSKLEAEVADIEAAVIDLGLPVPDDLQQALDDIDVVANSGLEISLEEAISALQSFRNQLQSLG